MPSQAWTGALQFTVVVSGGEGPRTSGRTGPPKNLTLGWRTPPARPSQGARPLPVDEQESARRVELGFAWSSRDLELQLLDLVLGAIPAGQGVILVSPGAGEQHHVDVRVVGHA